MINRRNVRRLVLLSCGFLSVIPVTCNSILAKSKADPDDSYEYVTATGSMVRQRVKKGEAAASDSPTETMTGEQFDKMRQRLQLPAPKPGGP